MSDLNIATIEGCLINSPNLSENKCLLSINSNDSILSVEVLGKLAETCGFYLTTGSKILISGTLKEINGKIKIIGKEINFIQTIGDKNVQVLHL